MNVKVGDIIQYYAYKIADVLDKAQVVNQCESVNSNILTKKNFLCNQLFTLKIYAKIWILNRF